ncbi:MAG: hypothetical protein EXR66_00305 [Dehalococcoidia bacterium]|nr:hypothetical protein [Dehalococcoidia bacterium]
MTQEPVPPAQRMPGEDFPTGPEVGECFPDYTLHDQHNEHVGIEAARAGRKAFIVLQRSARW